MKGITASRVKDGWHVIETVTIHMYCLDDVRDYIRQQGLKVEMTREDDNGYCKWIYAK